MKAEIKRVVEAKEAKSDGEAMVKAAAAMGYTIAIEELERASAELESMEEDELDSVTGAGEDEHGHSNWCVVGWHCYEVFLHTETTSHDVACAADHSCIYLQWSN